MGYLSDYVDHIKWYGAGAYSPMMYALYRNVDDRTKYAIDDFYRSLPLGIGSLYRGLDTYHQLDDYMKNNPNVDWSDALRYHKNVIGVGNVVNVAMSGYNFVSKNLDKLYENNGRQRREDFWNGYRFAQTSRHWH